MLRSKDELMELVKIRLSTSSDLLTDDGYERAADDALSELSYTLPLDNGFKERWLSDRGLRHALFIIWVASAQSFKYKLVNLQHRFDHYKILIENMDKSFEKAIADNPTSFLGIDAFKMFGTKIDAGFAYDAVGNDITYNTENLVNFSGVTE
jgi:hypothetical protein